MNIFVIEDDLDIRASLIGLLACEGYEVEWARDGYQALERLRLAENLPDLIILDLAMPIMNGFEFREHQLREEKICDVPVVSPVDDPAEVQAVLAAGADGYLPKPYRFDHMLECIRQFDPQNGR